MTSDIPQRETAPPTRTPADEPVLAAYPLRAVDKLRYADTDRQGHINNTVFCSALETGRVELLYETAAPLAEPGASFVIARLELDFRAEMTWPGEVTIGTATGPIGRSSFELRQALFQGARCVGVARSIIVQVDQQTGSARPLPLTCVERLRALQLGDIRP